MTTPTCEGHPANTGELKLRRVMEQQLRRDISQSDQDLCDCALAKFNEQADREYFLGASWAVRSRLLRLALVLLALAVGYFFTR